MLSNFTIEKNIYNISMENKKDVYFWYYVDENNEIKQKTGRLNDTSDLIYDGNILKLTYNLYLHNLKLSNEINSKIESGELNI
jgi:hypothetical protein